MSNELTYKDKFAMACERLEDILKADDGQAYKEARKFLDLHAPKKIDKPPAIYQTMAEIIEEIDPPEQVMRLWLQSRGIFISQADDARVVSIKNNPAFGDKSRIQTMTDLYRIAFDAGRNYPEGEPIRDSAPKKITDAMLRSLYKAAFNDGLAERNLEGVEVDSDETLWDSPEAIKLVDGMRSPEFPQYVRIDQAETCLKHEGGGYYHRTAGEWGVTAKPVRPGGLSDTGGVIILKPSDNRLKHLEGVLMVPCTKEEHDKCNGLD